MLVVTQKFDAVAGRRQSEDPTSEYIHRLRGDNDLRIVNGTVDTHHVIYTVLDGTDMDKSLGLRLCQHDANIGIYKILNN